MGNFIVINAAAKFENQRGDNEFLLGVNIQVDYNDIEKGSDEVSSVSRHFNISVDQDINFHKLISKMLSEHEHLDPKEKYKIKYMAEVEDLIVKSNEFCWKWQDCCDLDDLEKNISNLEEEIGWLESDIEDKKADIEELEELEDDLELSYAESDLDDLEEELALKDDEYNELVALLEQSKECKTETIETVHFNNLTVASITDDVLKKVPVGALLTYFDVFLKKSPRFFKTKHSFSQFMTPLTALFGNFNGEEMDFVNIDECYQALKIMIWKLYKAIPGEEVS